MSTRLSSRHLQGAVRGGHGGPEATTVQGCLLWPLVLVTQVLEGGTLAATRTTGLPGGYFSGHQLKYSVQAHLQSTKFRLRRGTTLEKSTISRRMHRRRRPEKKGPIFLSILGDDGFIYYPLPPPQVLVTAKAPSVTAGQPRENSGGGCSDSNKLFGCVCKRS